MIGIADALQTLRHSEQVSYVLDSSLNLVYHNKAWDKFAEENSAPELAGPTINGINLLDVVDQSLRPFYTDAFNRVAQENRVWEWAYECSSPERFRKFLMRVHPIKPGAWFLVTNHVLVEGQHVSRRKELGNEYTDGRGQIQVCVHCRCSKRVVAPERWDFVPEHLTPELENVAHGLCPICEEYFYPSRRA